MRKETIIIAFAFFVIVASVAAAAEEKFTLIAENKPIQEFLKEVAKITGKNLLVDPSVTGTVTLVSPAPLTKEEVWKVAQSALSINGYTTVEHGAIVKIVSKEKAASEPIPTIFPPTYPRSEDEIVTAIIDLKYLKPAKAVESVTPLLGPEGKVAVAPNLNAVLAIDSEANIARMRELLARLDTPEESSDVVAMPLERASASEVASILTQLFDKAGGVKGGGCRCRFTSEPRSNSVLIRAPAADRQAAKKLAKKIDGGDEAFNVARLKNMDAEEAKRLLQSLSN